MMHRIAVGFLLLCFTFGSAFAATDPSKKTEKDRAPAREGDKLAMMSG